MQFSLQLFYLQNYRFQAFYIAALAFFISLHPYPELLAQERDEFSGRLLLVSNQVGKIEKDIATLKSEYAALVAERKQLEASLTKNKEEEKRLIGSLKGRAAKRLEIEKELQGSQQDLGRREAKVKARIRALYVSSVYYSYGDVMFRSHGDEVERIAVYAKALRRHDESLFKDLRASVERVTTARSDLDSAEKSEHEAQVSLQTKRTELETALLRSKSIGDEIVGKKKGAEKALMRLRDEAEHLESLLEQLTKTEEQSASSSEKGTQPSPVEISTENGSTVKVPSPNQTNQPSLETVAEPAPTPVSTSSVPKPSATPPTVVPVSPTPSGLEERASDKDVETKGTPEEEETVTLTGLFLKGKTLKPPVQFRILQPFGKGKGSSFSDIVTSKGVDGEAQVGTRVEALAAGRVAFVGPMPGFGTVVILDHGKRQYSLYGRLGESMVSKGMLIPERRAVGTTGPLSEKGRNFYLEVRRDGIAVDPAGVVRGLR